MPRITAAYREYIRKSLALHAAMERATSEEEFQRLLAEHDNLTDAQRFPRFARRTLAAMKAPFDGGAPSTPPSGLAKEG
jgi:cell division protein FtsL